MPPLDSGPNSFDIYAQPTPLDLFDSNTFLCAPFNIDLVYRNVPNDTDTPAFNWDTGIDWDEVVLGDQNSLLWPMGHNTTIPTNTHDQA